MKVLLLDEDQDFAKRLATRLRETDIDLQWRASLFELGSVGKLGEYDLVLVEPLIGPVNGLEIAEYAETFFQGLPVLLIGERDLPVSLWLWPKSVIGFVRKEPDLDRLVTEVTKHGVARSNVVHHFPERVQKSRYATA